MSRRRSLVVFLLLGCTGVNGWRDQATADLSLVFEASPNPVLPNGSITFVLTVTPAGGGGCARPDPFVALGGGICENGGCRPRGL